MGRKISLFLLLFMVKGLSAQWQINLMVNPHPPARVSQWRKTPGIASLSVTYMGGGTKEAIVRVRIRGERAGEILVGHSTVQSFESGRPVQFNNSNMIDWNSVEYNEKFQRILARTGRLPADNYEICVDVIETGNRTPSASRCVSFEIIAPSPPRLLSPANGDTVTVRGLIFRWTPVRAYPPTVPRYRIRIWRVFRNEPPRMAMRRAPVLEDEVTTTSYMLPLRRRVFNVGGKYIWAVQAVDSRGNPIGSNNGMSEIWRFVVAGGGAGRSLPHILKVGHFIVRVGSYDASSRISSLSGSGRSYFYDEQTGNHVWFNVDFDGLVGGSHHGDTLIITRGTVTSDISSPIELNVAGFKLHISSVTIMPDSALAELYMTHPCIYDTGSPEFWELGPFTTAIDTDGAFVKTIDGSDLEPFRMADLDIYFEVNGNVLIDMAARNLTWGSTGGDSTGSTGGGSTGGGSTGGGVINPGVGGNLHPTLPGNITRPQMGPIVYIPGMEFWRGIVFHDGNTIERPEMAYSNTGYLYGKFSFSTATLTDSGLSVDLDNLVNQWNFTTVSPFGFEFVLNDAEIKIQNCKVVNGHLDGYVRLPYGKNGVTAQDGDTLIVEFDSLAVDSTLTFAGTGFLSKKFISWGNYTVCHLDGDVNLLFKGRPRPFYSLVKSDSFTTHPHLDTLVGMTMRLDHKDTLFIQTEDVKDGPIRIFQSSLRGWFVLDEQGITGRVWFEEKGGSYFAGEFGRPGKPDYKSDSTFKISLVVNPRDSMSFYLEFAGNSTFDSRLDGLVDRLPYPTTIQFQFRRMNLTSVAQIVGGKIHFTQPETLDYWGVTMDCKTGYMSVRSGEALFTNALISEPVHFSAPFNIIWSEIAADGGLKRIDFSQNSAYQKFDGFPITLDSAGLSQYRSGSATPTSYGALVVRSYIHFDFFGSSDTLVTVYDYKSSDTTKPYYGRYALIDSPSVFGLKREWGYGLANFNLDKVTYDTVKQNGFLGSGSFSIDYLSGSLYMAGDLKSDGIRLCITDSSNVFSLSMGGQNLLSIMDIWGCAYIDEGELKRIAIGGTLTRGSTVLFLSTEGTASRVMLSVTPTVTRLVVEGRYEFKSLTRAVEADAYARLEFNRGDSYLEGDIYGMFKFGSGTPLASGYANAYGRFTFHTGLDYTVIQGEATVAIDFSVTLVGGFSSGVKGGFFLGVNVPKEKAWVLTKRNGRFGVNMDNLPSRLTGFYAYGDVSSDIDIGLFGGGVEVFLGVGAMNTGVGDTCGGMPLPYVIGDFGIYLYGEILWGVVSASGTFEGQFIGPCPFAIEGTIRLKGCVLWVMCAEVGVTVGVSSTKGVYIE